MFLLIDLKGIKRMMLEETGRKIKKLGKMELSKHEVS